MNPFNVFNNGLGLPKIEVNTYFEITLSHVNINEPVRLIYKNTQVKN